MLASSCFSWVLLVSDECVAQHLSFTDTRLELVVSRWKRVMDHCPIHEGSEECRGKSPPGRDPGGSEPISDWLLFSFICVAFFWACFTDF